LSKHDDFGKRIKAFRLSKEMTQGEAAVFFGIGSATLQRLECGAKGSDLTRARIEKRIKNLTERQSVAA
jgi:transcriptional regulator with XRE-family HTH domain